MNRDVDLCICVSTSSLCFDVQIVFDFEHVAFVRLQRVFWDTDTHFRTGSHNIVVLI
jgi:hypothetical protein